MFKPSQFLNSPPAAHPIWEDLYNKIRKIFQMLLLYLLLKLWLKAVHRNTSKVINSFEMYLILLRALSTEHFIPKGFSKILPTTYCILMLPQFVGA